MKVKTGNGVTEMHFADLERVEPKVVRLRAAFREKKIDATEVERWCMKLFGQTRFNKDYDRVTEGETNSAALRKWDEWIEAQPMIYRKLFYDPRVVAACITGEDE